MRNLSLISRNRVRSYAKFQKKKKKIRFNIHNYKIKGQNFTIKFGHCLLLGTINLHNDIYCLA